MKDKGETKGGTLREERKHARMLPELVIPEGFLSLLNLPYPDQAGVHSEGSSFSNMLWKRTGETS